MMFSGVLSICSRGLVVSMARVDTIRERKQALSTLIATALRMLCGSFAPNFWLMITEKPAVRPTTKPRMRKVIEPVAPTAAKASTPT
ncbi:hypothetical protein SDC9_211725 [bioreactor metagenome]|uniref:Uncharacterized protein n=1 Tax=bioreactor metagenome TaxID=1076179 RepID=A0A645JKK4_9ZZZZ